jgi:hypothetical protein
MAWFGFGDDDEDSWDEDYDVSELPMDRKDGFEEKGKDASGRPYEYVDDLLDRIDEMYERILAHTKSRVESHVESTSDTGIVNDDFEIERFISEVGLHFDAECARTSLDYSDRKTRRLEREYLRSVREFDEAYRDLEVEADFVQEKINAMRELGEFTVIKADDMLADDQSDHIRQIVARANALNESVQLSYAEQFADALNMDATRVNTDGI